jgi:integrase
MKRKLSQKAADALVPTNHTYICYDLAPPGFGCRVTPNAVKSWIFDYRPGGGRKSDTRRLTLGRVDALPYVKAHRTAEELYHRTRLGEDPAGKRDEQRGAPTLNELIERYLAEEARPTLKPGTVRLYTSYFDNHVRPALGRKRARDIGHNDVIKLHRAIGARGNEVAANRVVDLISSFYGWAGKAKFVPRDTNPARDVTRFRELARTRYLSREELVRLGQTLELAETEGLPAYEADGANPKAKHNRKLENRRTVISPYAVAAIRLLLLTGCRLSEVLGLTWSMVDLEHGILVLEDSKTGPRTVWLNSAALAELDQLSRIPFGNYVIAGQYRDAPRRDLQRPWRQIAKHARLEGAPLHALRHTHASIGVGAGVSLPMVGALLGHRVSSTTSRYAHIAHDPARRASEAIGLVIAGALNGGDRDHYSADV